MFRKEIDLRTTNNEKKAGSGIESPAVFAIQYQVDSCNISSVIQCIAVLEYVFVIVWVGINIVVKIEAVIEAKSAINIT